MNRFALQGIVRCGHQFRHQSWRVEWGGGAEYDSPGSVGMPGLDVVFELLVIAPVPLVLLNVLKQNLVELLEVVLGEWDVEKTVEDRLQQLGIAADFGFVPRAETVYAQSLKDTRHFVVGELGTLDPGAAARRFNCRDLPK